MRRSLRVETVARDELRESALFLDEQQPGLGEELTAAVAALLDEILARAETYPVVRRAHGLEARRALEQRFRFRVIFVVRPRSVWVISIARQSRRPYYWLDRLRRTPPE